MHSTGIARIIGLLAQPRKRPLVPALATMNERFVQAASPVTPKL
jgi:hypothetical protein